MNYYGLDALLHGGIAALLTFPPALVLFWRATALLNAGARLLRPIVAISAAFGLSQLLSDLWALVFERTSFQDEAMVGALIAAGLLAVAAFPLLLLLRWWQRRQPPSPGT
jgi:hypothetical protein